MVMDLLERTIRVMAWMKKIMTGINFGLVMS